MQADSRFRVVEIAAFVNTDVHCLVDYERIQTRRTESASSGCHVPPSIDWQLEDDSPVTLEIGG